MPVSCKVIQDLLPLYLDGVSSKESSALVEMHLAQCAQCSSLSGEDVRKDVRAEPNRRW